MGEQNIVWSDYVFEGKLIKVRVDTVEVPGSGQREREIVEHPGAVGVLPVLEDGRIVLVRQFRPAVGRSLLEIPAGTSEPGEAAERTATRELEEETGYSGGTLTELARFFVSPGWCNEELVVFTASGISPGDQSPEDDEQIDIELVAPGQIVSLIRSGDIGDAKTLVALTTHLDLNLTR